MRVLTEDKLLALRRQLEGELSQLAKRARAIRAEVRILDSLAAELTEIEAPSPEPAAPVSGADDTARRVSDALDEYAGNRDRDEELDIVPQPDSSASPINRVQTPILDLVRRRPGMPRPVVQRLIADSGLTTVESARETVRRMLANGKLRTDGANRLFVNEEAAGDESPPAFFSESPNENRMVG